MMVINYQGLYSITISLHNPRLKTLSSGVLVPLVRQKLVDLLPNWNIEADFRAIYDHDLGFYEVVDRIGCFLDPPGGPSRTGSGLDRKTIYYMLIVRAIRVPKVERQTRP